MDEFEWDERKSKWTLVQRGFGFDYAARIFDGPIVEVDDRRFNYGERRILATGVVNGRFITVVYTPRGSARRIISARPATREERHGYRSLYG